MCIQIKIIQFIRFIAFYQNITNNKTAIQIIAKYRRAYQVINATLHCKKRIESRVKETYVSRGHV